MLVDSHAHLDSSRLWEDLPQVLNRARQAGVGTVLTITCVGPDEKPLSERALWVKEYAGVYSALGVHPHDSRYYNPQMEEEIADLMGHPRVLGWGEIGLDYFYDNSPRDLQVAAFRSQLRRALLLDMPVIVHSRDAAEETCEILAEETAGKSDHPVLMHCFTYDQTVAERCLEAGYSLSFGGMVTFPRSEELRRVAAMVPEDRFLIETDSPYLAPVPHRGKTNEPAFVLEVARKLAEIRGVSLEAVADQSSRNFARFFRTETPG